MNIEKLLRRMNIRLGAELGTTIDNQPTYKWIFSEDPVLMHPMRLPNEFDYRANEFGIVEVIPLYTLRKMCLAAVNQWVLCHWLPSPSEDEWRRIFGYSLEWPKGGQYYPTNVYLDPGEAPNAILTQTVIDCVKETRAKSAAQVEREAAENETRKEAAQKDRLFETIREELTTYDHIPGARDAVSYPGVEHDTSIEGLLRRA